MKADRPRFGLQGQIVAGIVALLALQGLAAALVLGGSLRRELLSQLDQRALGLARQLAELAVDPVLTEQRLDLQVLVAHYVRSHEGAAWAYVQDARGAVVAHSFPAGFPQGLLVGEGPRTVATESIRVLDTELGRVREGSAPLLDGAAGRVCVALSEKPATRAMGKAFGAFLAVMLAILLGGGALMAWYALRIVRPVLAVTQAARAIASGEVRARARVRATGEIAGLAAAFNEMAEDLERFRKDAAISREYRDNILHSLSEAIVVLASDGRIQEMNAAARGLLGWGADELAGQPVDLLFAAGAARLAPGTPWATLRNLETALLTKDGRVLPVLLSVSVVRGSGDEVQAVVCAARETPTARPAGIRASASGSAACPG